MNILVNLISPESRFNGLHFCKRLHMSVFIVLSLVSCKCRQKSLKLLKRHKKRHLMWVQGHWNCHQLKAYGICDYLLVVKSNLGCISHRFRATANYWSKIDSGTYQSHLTPSPEVTSCKYIDKPYIAKNLIHCATHQWRQHHPTFICFDTIPACDGWTDRNAIANTAHSSSTL